MNLTLVKVTSNWTAKSAPTYRVDGRTPWDQIPHISPMSRKNDGPKNAGGKKDMTKILAKCIYMSMLH